MANISKNDLSLKSSKDSLLLDTLEVTSDLVKSKSHETLYWSTLRKANTVQTNLQLIDISNRVWAKKYWQSFHCKNILLQDGDKLKGSLCRKRWCQNCNRIKTAELVNGYSEPLKELQGEDDLFFITLTSPTVKAKRLRFEIDRKYKAFTKIKDNLRKNYNIKLVGIRKLEITYNPENDWYHPHFHFIQQGRKEAELLLKFWHEHNPLASSKAQDITLIDANDPKALVEIFKYATKEVAKDEFSAKALHNIYKSLDGKRAFQTYGKLRKVTKPVEAQNETSKADFTQSAVEIWKYNHKLKDYTNAYNQKLIGTQDITQELHENKNNKNNN